MAKGAAVLTGGRARPDLGPYFYEPTVLEGVTADDGAASATRPSGRSSRSTGSTTTTDAVACANDRRLRPERLDLQPGRRARPGARRGGSRCGTVNINEAYAATWGSTAAPMGGMKDSGLGRRHGSEGMLTLHRVPDRRGAAPGRHLAAVRPYRRAVGRNPHGGGARDEGPRRPVQSVAGAGEPRTHPRPEGAQGLHRAHRRREDSGPLLVGTAELR